MAGDLLASTLIGFAWTHNCCTPRAFEMLRQVPKGQWQFFQARESGLRFVCGLLLLLLGLFRPGWHHAICSRVGDGLTEVLAEVPGNGDEGTAQWCRAIEHFLRFVGIRLVEGDDVAAKMCERILQGLQNFWLICGECCDGLEIKASRRR